MKERIKEFAELAGDDWDYTLESDKQFLHKFANLVAAHEREECAKVCESGIIETNNWDVSYWNQACENAAFRIRTRGEK